MKHEPKATVHALARAYQQRVKAHWTDAAWSGNVGKELIGLIDFEKPETVIGRKHLTEMTKGSEGCLRGD